MTVFTSALQDAAILLSLFSPRQDVWFGAPVPRTFAWLLSELVLLSALILSVMTSDRHHFILHYPVDTAASGATLLSLPASKSQAGWSPLLRDVYHTITLSGEGPTVTLGLMELLKPWRCKLWQIRRQEVTIINRRDKKRKKEKSKNNKGHKLLSASQRAAGLTTKRLLLPPETFLFEAVKVTYLKMDGLLWLWRIFLERLIHPRSYAAGAATRHTSVSHRKWVWAKPYSTYIRSLTPPPPTLVSHP